MTRQPAAADETDAAIRDTFLRLAAQLEATAREAREAAGEDIYGPSCRRHGWQNCEDLTCRRIAEASAVAVAAERERIAQLALSEAAKSRASDFSVADGIGASALEDFADLIRETT